MDTQGKHTEEKERREEYRREMEDKAYQEMKTADSLKQEGKNRKKTGGIVSSRLWLWLGVLVLIFILLYWLFAIGTFGDLQDWFNG